MVKIRTRPARRPPGAYFSAQVAAFASKSSPHLVGAAWYASGQVRVRQAWIGHARCERLAWVGYRLVSHDGSATSLARIVARIVASMDISRRCRRRPHRIEEGGRLRAMALVLAALPQRLARPPRRSGSRR